MIIPAHNASRWLPETLKSLQRQTLGDWVCVIVDDGSRDETLAVARALAARDARITVHHQDASGVSSARNAGIALLPVAVSWLHYLDSDDLLLPDALEVLAAALAARPDAVGSYGIAEYVDESGAPTDPGEQPRRQRDRRAVLGRRLVSVPPTADLTFAELVVNGPIVPPSVALLRREAVTAAGGWDSAVATQEDWELYARMSRRGPFVATDRRVSWYRRHPGNVTGRLSDLRWAQADVRRRLWRDPANDRQQRREAARAWRYLRLRDGVMLALQMCDLLRAGDRRGAGRAALGVGLVAAQLPLAGPPPPRWAQPDLTTPRVGSGPVRLRRPGPD